MFNFFWQNPELDRSFFAACQRGDLPQVLALQQQNPNVNKFFPINIIKPNGETFSREHSALSIACALGYVEIVNVLLAHPHIEVNARSDTDATAFFRACQAGQYEIVKLLMEDPRIDIDTREKNGWTPLIIACEQRFLNIMELLLASSKPLKVNRPENKNFTALHLACQLGYFEGAKLLLADPRIEVNKVMHNNRTALFMACQERHTNIVEILLKHKDIDPHIAYDKFQTSFLISYYQQNSPILALLLQYEIRKDFGLAWATPSQILQKAIKPEIFSYSGMTITEKNKIYLSSTKIADFPELDLQEIIQASQLLIRKEYAAQLFALVVLSTDGYLSPTLPSLEKHHKLATFLILLLSLPIELQMVLCNRAYQLSGDLILTKFSEIEFKRTMVHYGEITPENNLASSPTPTEEDKSDTQFLRHASLW